MAMLLLLSWRRRAVVVVRGGGVEVEAVVAAWVDVAAGAKLSDG